MRSRKAKSKSIGVSNFNPAHVETLMKSDGVTIRPSVNQMELHAWSQQKEIVDYCKKEDIAVEAHSPLTQGKNLGDPVTAEVAKKHSKTSAHVIIRWVLQQGIVAIPKSENQGRTKENTGMCDFELDENDLNKIATLDAGQDGNVAGWNPWI